jgi:hypothetical protein
MYILNEIHTTTNKGDTSAETVFRIQIAFHFAALLAQAISLSDLTST